MKIEHCTDAVEQANTSCELAEGAILSAINAIKNTVVLEDSSLIGTLRKQAYEKLQAMALQISLVNDAGKGALQALNHIKREIANDPIRQTGTQRFIVKDGRLVPASIEEVAAAEGRSVAEMLREEQELLTEDETFAEGVITSFTY